MDWLIASFLALLSNPDTYGHLFYIVILTGTTLVGNKKKIGWLFRIVGDIGWVLIGWWIGMTSIIVWSSVFALNEIRNFLIWKWSEDENKQLQIKRPGATKVRSTKDKGSVRAARRRRSKPADGKPGAGSDVIWLGPSGYISVHRMQEYEAVSVPKRARSSKSKREGWADAGRSLEAAEKRVRSFNRIHEFGRLPKAIKGKK